MTLVLNDEQRMLRDAARGFLAERAPVTHLRELRDRDVRDGMSRELWSDMVDLGWAAILVPEKYGGLGYGFTGLGLVLEECGRTLTPSPLLGTAMIGAAALTRAGSREQCEALLPRIASGEHLLALAVDEGPHHRPEVCRTAAKKTATGYEISGAKTAVLDGQVADTLIVSATVGTGDGGGVALFLVPADSPGVSMEPVMLLDTHRAARFRIDGVEVPESALLGSASGGVELLDYVLDVARIGQSAEMLGLAQEVFERTLDYLRDRKQFGVPIGSFQGLQHRAAVLYGELEMSKSAVLNALRALDTDAGNLAAIASMTKAKLCCSAHEAAAEGIQMHGGMGMTDEFEIGFFLKRCRILETVYGDRYFHLDRFARRNGY